MKTRKKQLKKYKKKTLKKSTKKKAPKSFKKKAPKSFKKKAPKSSKKIHLRNKLLHNSRQKYIQKKGKSKIFNHTMKGGDLVNNIVNVPEFQKFLNNIREYTDERESLIEEVKQELANRIKDKFVNKGKKKVQEIIAETVLSAIPFVGWAFSLLLKIKNIKNNIAERIADEIEIYTSKMKIDSDKIEIDGNKLMTQLFPVIVKLTLGQAINLKHISNNTSSDKGSNLVNDIINVPEFQKIFEYTDQKINAFKEDEINKVKEDLANRIKDKFVNDGKKKIKEIIAETVLSAIPFVGWAFSLLLKIKNRKNDIAKKIADEIEIYTSKIDIDNISKIDVDKLMTQLMSQLFQVIVNLTVGKVINLKHISNNTSSDIRNTTQSEPEA